MTTYQPHQSITDLFNLKGQVAIVTGGALGIGQGIAFRLAEAGATVMITDINPEAAQSTVAQIKESGGTAASMMANVANLGDEKHAIEETIKIFGRLDILVNNAGIFPFAPALEVTEQLWDKVMGVNLKGLFFTTQAAAREMIKQGHGGKIINIASIDALHPSGMLVHYDTSKGGVAMMTKSLALEFGPKNILVNAIAPGGIQTPGASSPDTSEELLKAFTARIPLRRMGIPDDIAKAALFLASDMASYMNGSLIVIDGGYLQA
ncbi:2-deoxy-D-gluconate 3-dehydrogenase [Dictyobacter alpinus]|uniref:2-deoxy-D-gluconate 3-dehydrogenase n=1 Tax=Dictyobacter alpinus TaxID=2014873 RepID=A0A402B7P4_9CHLR|nr:SDR family oxidoreductase [Dictyobacter alpinus]GCE27381.1 2-deoxy-D-gluconate 3-dehydrogenase [Dictyobacter alpinus]